jgi:hypothetical protein
VPESVGDSGTLETYTTLYATPEGFSPPHTLALIGLEGGDMVLARYPKYLEKDRFKIGQRVVLKKRGDSILFETGGFLQNMRDKVKSLFGRKTPRGKRNQNTGP